ELCVLSEVGRKDLDGDAAVEAGVPSLPNLPHPAGPKRRDDFVRPEAGTRADDHGRRAIVPAKAGCYARAAMRSVISYRRATAREIRTSSIDRPTSTISASSTVSAPAIHLLIANSVVSSRSGSASSGMPRLSRRFMRSGKV